MFMQIQSWRCFFLWFSMSLNVCGNKLLVFVLLTNVKHCVQRHVLVILTEHCGCLGSGLESNILSP